MISSESAQDAVRELLLHIGENPNREGLRETPERVVRALVEMTSGYSLDPKDVLKLFPSEGYDEIVALKDIPFASICEHHLLPFVGIAHIGYIPAPHGVIVGLSKLPRLLDIYTKRLQIQERITTQVTSALNMYLQPLASGCILEATHCCLSCRGVRREGVMVTSSMTGAFRDNSDARAEFLRLIGK